MYKTKNNSYILNATVSPVEIGKVSFNKYINKTKFKIDQLPQIVDLRKDWGPCYDQGPLPSCVPNSIIGNLRCVSKKLSNGTVSFNGSRMFNYYTARLINWDVNEVGGTNIGGCAFAIKMMGLCEEKEWPYVISTVKDKPSPQAFDKASLYNCKWYDLGLSLDNMKKCLSEGYPISFCLWLTNTWGVTGDTINPPGKDRTGGHAMNLVGYDDNRQCFLVANSWGEWGGNKGFFYLAYDYALTQGWEFTTFRFFGNVIEPTIIPDAVQAFNGDNFQDECLVLKLNGNYSTLASLNNIGIDSISIPKGLIVNLYPEENFGGTPIILSKSSRWLFKFINLTRSIKVLKTNPNQGPSGPQGPQGPPGNYDKQMDFVLGKSNERGDSGSSRALVKGNNASLIINYDGDFKGGVCVNGPNLTVKGNLIVNGIDILNEINKLKK